MLQIALLGGLALELDGEPHAAPRAAGARELLAWLALHPDEQPRVELAARFWPDVLDESARQSLRNALWNLRRDLGPAADVILARRDTLALRDDVTVDSRVLDAAVARGDAESVATLAERGELLRGFDQEWAIAAREQRREQVGAVLAERVRTAGAAGEAVAWARRRARLDPLSEDAVREVMLSLERAGDTAAALAVHDRFAQRLRRELRAAPSPTTREVAERLRSAPCAERGAASTSAASDLLPRPLPLTGRGTELAALLGEWAAARRREGGVLVLEGDAGAGKTRLAAELVARARGEGARVAVGVAVELTGAAPLAPWAEILEALVDPPAGAPWVADLARLVPRLGAARATGDLDRVRLHEAVVAGIADVAASGPVLVVLEDAHGADAATLALTAHLGRRLRTLPVLLLVTRRPAPPRAELDAVEAHLAATGAGRPRLVLAPLRDTEAAALVRAVAPLDAADVRRAVDAADGNALLAVESARALAGGHAGPPPSLRTHVRSLLGALPEDARAVAELLAVAGRPLDPAELEALPVADPALAACEAIAAGLLADTEAAGFRHALLRDAARATVAPPRLRVLHGRLADALIAAGRAQPAEIARHLRRAGRDAAAVPWLAGAARSARDLAALREARAFAQEAVGLRPADPELWLLLAHVEALRGRHAEARAASDEGLALIGPEDRRARGLALLDRGLWLSSALCWPVEALADLRAAAPLLDDEPGLDAERARLLAASAWAEAVAGEPDRVEGLLAAAAELCPRGTRADVDVHVVAARINALVRQGRAPEALALAGELEAAGRGDGTRHRLGDTVWLELSSVAAFVGDFDRALAFVQRYLAESGGLPTKRIEGLAGLAYVLVRLERGDEAVAAAEEMVALADELGADELPALSRHDLGMVLCEIGEHERGTALIAAALADGVRLRGAQARLRRAESLVALQRLDEAAGDLRAAVLEPLTPADQPETLVPRIARVQALLAAARDDPAAAARLLSEAAAGWRRLQGLDQRAAYMSNLVDLGRPPVAGLTEPARELARVEREREEVLHAELR